MTPKVAKLGTSFKGAGAYYLHDKGAQTTGRVAWTHTENLPTSNPANAINRMIYTATHADDLKRAAGGVLKGKKATKVVYSYSLAWQPDEKPDQQEQLKTAQSSLKALGLDKHQALIVAHNDTDHPHVHVIVNRVNPRDGIATPIANDFPKLSRWAQAYEEERGHVVCPQRVINNKKRDQRKWVKDRDSVPMGQIKTWRNAQNTEVWDTYRQDKEQAETQLKNRLDTIWQNRQTARKTITKAIREEYRPYWRELFKRQEREREKFSKAGLLTKFARVVGDAIKGENSKQNLAEKQALQRKELSEAQQGYIVSASRQIDENWQVKRGEIYAQHHEDKQERLKTAREASEQAWQGKPTQEQDNAPQQAKIDTARPLEGTAPTFNEASQKKTTGRMTKEERRQRRAERKPRRKRSRRKRSRGGGGRSLDIDD